MRLTISNNNLILFLIIVQLNFAIILIKKISFLNIVYDYINWISNWEIILLEKLKRNENKSSLFIT